MQGAEGPTEFAASPLPVIGRVAGARRAAGIALAYAARRPRWRGPTGSA